MHDTLDRLYRTKLLLLAVLLLVSGIALLVFGLAVQSRMGWEWLANWPIADIGSGMFTTGLLAVAWQYLDGRDSEARDTKRLRRVLAESAPAMRDAVIHGFAFQPDDLARVATPEVLDQVVTNGLAIRLGDAGFAADIYNNIQEQAIAAPERLHDARVSIHLSPLPAGSGTAKGRTGEFYVATIRWESSLHPRYQTRRFSCVSDIKEFRDLRQDSAANSAWYVGPRTGLAADSEDVFELLDFTVNGATRPIRRTAKAGSQTYSVNLGSEALTSENRITVAYTYRTLVSADEHLLQLRVDQPTRGITVEIDFTATRIEYVNVLDFLGSNHAARITRSSTTVPERFVQVCLDGWAFPRSGVAFVWINGR